MVSTYSCGNVIGPHTTWRNKQNTQSSLIDYIFIPEDMKTSVLKTKIHDSVPFNVSDHFPVTVSFLSDRFITGEKMWTYLPLKWDKAK